MTTTMPNTAAMLQTVRTHHDVPASITEMQTLAHLLSSSRMLPKHLWNDEPSILLMMLKARTLDIPMSAAFEGVLVIEGKTALSAHMIQALTLRAGYGMWLVQEECNEEQAVMRCVRPGIGSDGGDTAYVKFTIEDAIRAELVTRDSQGKLVARSKDGTKVLPWQKYGPDMLKRRVSSRSGRDYFGDILLGMAYLPEEIGADTDDAVFRESTRLTISPEVAAILLRVQNANDTDALTEVWNEARVAGLLDAVNIAGETVRNVLTMRGETLQRRAGKKPAVPKPKDDAPTDAVSDAPVDAETEPADTAADDAAVTPDPPETRQDTPDREQLCNVLADLYPNGWEDVVAACVERYGLEPDDTATAKLEELARDRMAGGDQ